MYKKGQPSPKTSPRTQAAFNHHDHIKSFREAIYAHTGASPEIVADGKFHRFDDPQGKRQNMACWYVLNVSSIPFGAMGNWRTNEKWCWTATGRKNLTFIERIELEEAFTREKARRELQQQADWDDAAHVAHSKWNLSQSASPSHPYLIRKGVPPLKLRTLNGVLLAPIQSTNGELWNLQFIYTNGEKRFLKGGRIRGLFSLIGKDRLPAFGRLYICEGVATAITIHLETNAPVAAALSCGNLEPVAKAIKRAAPELELIIAADNDHQTLGNPGMTKAKEAASNLHCGIVHPSSCGDRCKCTDFNDVANCENWEAAK